MKRVFGLDGEPKTNHAAPQPFWDTAKSSRPGVKEKLDNRPGPEFQKERADRLPAKAEAALRGLVGAPRDEVPRGDSRDQRFRTAHASGTTKLDVGAMDAGLFIQSLSGDDRGDPSEVRGQIRNTAHLRGLFGLNPKAPKIPPRGAVSAPRLIAVRWEKLDLPFPEAGVKLLGKLLEFQRFEFALSLGLTAAMAGQFCGLKKTRACELAKELQEAGWCHGWFVEKAMPLIQRGKIPRGREVAASCVATAFFMALLDDIAVVEIWLERIGYHTTFEPRGFEESLRDIPAPKREAIEYLVNSNLLWELYP